MQSSFLNTSNDAFYMNNKIVDLNTKAVSFMAQEGTHSPIVSPAIKSVLKELKTLVAKLQDEAHLVASLVAAGHHKGCKKTIDVQRKQLLQFLPMNTNQSPQQRAGAKVGTLGSATTEENVFLLFDQPLLISNHRFHPFLEPLPIECQFRLAAACMYNAGLYLHKEGLRTGKSAKLIKAVRYYKVAHEMVRSSLRFCSCREEDIILELGLLNNMGHAHAALSESLEAMDCIVEIQEVIKSNGRRILGGSFDKLARFFCLALTVGTVSNSFALAPAA